MEGKTSAVRQTPAAFGPQAIDGIKIRMLLDEALERGIGVARGIEARSFQALAIGAAAAQGVEAITRFNQQRTNLCAGKGTLQSMAGGNIAGSAGAIEEAFAGFQRAKVTAGANVASIKATIKPAATVVVRTGAPDPPADAVHKLEPFGDRGICYLGATHRTTIGCGDHGCTTSAADRSGLRNTAGLTESSASSRSRNASR
jgi:hypothetical protein